VVCQHGSRFLIPTSFPPPFFWVELADQLKKLQRDAIQQYLKYRSYDFFAQSSHHSDSISLASSVSTTTSASPRRLEGRERVEFKRDTFGFYGLQHRNEAGNVSKTMGVDMFGQLKPFKQIRLSHICAASFSNDIQFAAELGLPEGFKNMSRNYLLLPEAVERAFDAGQAIFVPSRSDHGPPRVTFHVVKPDDLPAGSKTEVMSYDKRELHLPLAGEGKVPYLRVLGWMAWLVKFRVSRGALAAEDESMLDASADSKARENLRSLVRSSEVYYRSGLPPFERGSTVDALTLAAP
jgi:hypothetical protein